MADALNLSGTPETVQYLFLYGTVGVKERQRSKADDVVSLLCVALGENCHPAGNDAAGTGNKLLHCPKRFAGGNNVVNDEHTLALDELGVGGVDDKLLHAQRGNMDSLELQCNEPYRNRC